LGKKWKERKNKRKGRTAKSLQSFGCGVDNFLFLYFRRTKTEGLEQKKAQAVNLGFLNFDNSLL
jgi:hypothetical protein